MSDEPRKFSWFPKMTLVLRSLPAEYVGEMAMAMTEYGTFGTEPQFSNPLLMAVFEGVREDIENSIAQRYSNKGGRPKSKDATKTPVTESETPVSDDKTRVSETETPVAETETRVTDEKSSSENVEPIPYQSIPYQSNPDQEKRKGGARGPARFRAPTPQEVDAFASEHGLSVDGAAFCDFYASKGWRVGSSPMRDWRAAARNWARRDAGGAGRAGARRGEVSAGDEYSRL